MTILQMQYLLNYLGYDTGGCEGVCGKKTKQAVLDFQKDFDGLTVTGEADEATQKAIRHAVAYGHQKKDHSGESKALTGTFWDEIQYFTRQEFACRCREYKGPYCDGFPVEPDETLVRLADRVRGHFGRPANRTSGIRCPQHNADSGGVANSKHMEGKALDYWIEGYSAAQVLEYVQAQPETNYAYAVDSSVVHMDVR